MKNSHHLLPWYLNATLDDSERQGFEQHLSGCTRCQAEMEVVEKLQAEIASNPDLLSDHPTPQAILAATAPGSADIETDSEEDVQAVLRHLSVCGFCTRESGWLQGTTIATPDTGAVHGMLSAIDTEGGHRTGRSAAEAPGRAASTSARVPGWFTRFALAAAVVVAAIAPPLLLAPSTVGPTGLVTAGIVRSIARGDESMTIGVVSGSTRVQLIFEVDLGAGDFPARLEVTTADGNRIFSGAIEGPADLLEGLFVIFGCARANCVDGDYTARVLAASPDRTPTEFRFRLTTTPGS